MNITIQQQIPRVRVFSWCPTFTLGSGGPNWTALTKTSAPKRLLGVAVFYVHLDATTLFNLFPLFLSCGFMRGNILCSIYIGTHTPNWWRANALPSSLA